MFARYTYVHTYDDVHVWYPPTVVKYPFILCVQSLLDLPLPTSFTALTSKDFSEFFQPVFKQGAHLKNKWATKGSIVPKVTVWAHSPGLQRLAQTYTQQTHCLWYAGAETSTKGRVVCKYLRTYKLRIAKEATVCACLCVNHYCMHYALNAKEWTGCFSKWWLCFTYMSHVDVSGWD